MIEKCPKVQPKDIVVMEVARGWTETLQVKAIRDGKVYAVDDEGEEFCAPLNYCDKVAC